MTDNEIRLEEVTSRLLDLEALSLTSCDCDMHLEIKIREFGGGIHYVRQCTVCGRHRGGSLKKDQALKELNSRTPPQFDPSIESIFYQKRRAVSAEIVELTAEKQQLLCLINGYKLECIHATMTAEYEKSTLQLCEMIEAFTNKYGQKRTISVLIKETMRLRQVAINELRQQTNRFSSELELKAWFEENFSQDFEIFPEVKGRHLAENVPVRIDYFIKARQALIDEGFHPDPFGVEVKYFHQEDKFTHKTSRGVWQTISYTDCEFDVNGNSIKPKFCLIFSNLSFHEELEITNSFGHLMENDSVQWRGMVYVANHANVGILGVKGSRDKNYGWEIKLGGGTYFTCRASEKKGKIFHKSNDNVINKIRIGNF